VLPDKQTFLARIGIMKAYTEPVTLPGFSPKAKLQAVRTSPRLSPWKNVVYARSRKTASASSSRNSFAGATATLFNSQNGAFRSTI
jgi:hypothetical protein